MTRKFDYIKLRSAVWDSETLNYVAQIHEYKGHQELFIRQKPAELERLVEIAKIQSTEGSNKIEGIITTSARIRQLVMDKTAPRSRNEKEIVGYRDVLNTINESYDYIPLTANYILQLHRNLLAHTDLSFGGHFKNTQNYITETHADGSTCVRFRPPAPYETEPYITAICSSYQQAAAMQSVDSLILIPIVIRDFLCVHPFNNGNGRMSRLLTLLLMYQNGYMVGKYISIEKKIEASKDAYYDALQEASVGWKEGKDDPTCFIKYMLGIIISAYREFEERIDITGAKSTAYDVVKTAVDRTLGKFTKRDMIEKCPSIGKSSVEQSLRKLCKEAYIVKMGANKNTYYVKADSIIHHK
ncbi:MAG: Fic family protein [Solobacterium sp.]|jgi:Fic family protein|nr:Fic family protein [Solobacterium sp.]